MVPAGGGSRWRSASPMPPCHSPHPRLASQPRRVALLKTSPSNSSILSWLLSMDAEHARPKDLQPCNPCACCACSAPLPEKAEGQITQEIQAIIRQITASVTFLPLLQDKCERFPHAAAAAAAAGQECAPSCCRCCCRARMRAPLLLLLLQGTHERRGLHSTAPACLPACLCRAACVQRPRQAQPSLAAL